MKILMNGPEAVSTYLFRARNAAGLPDGCEVGLALNFELPADGTAPEWIELLPAGPVTTGRDGRTWINDRPEALVAAQLEDRRDIPLDWEHSTELKAPEGEPAPAAGWIIRMEVRDGGALWGQVAWTERGRASVAAREYRYISPVFVYELETLRIRQITSAGLTNRPNLQLQALNHEQRKDHAMTLAKLLLMLGLPENATLEQAQNAIAKLQSDLATALNRAETPSLDKFVPRADYDAAIGRATNAEKAFADAKTAELESAINAEIDAALKAGKIVPATKDFYVSMCRQDGGLDQFKAFVAAAPTIGDASGLDGKTVPESLALNAETKTIADMFGHTADDLKKFGA